MAYFWNPFSGAEFENQQLILRLPDSGVYIRVEGPIVELLSQLPFVDIDSAVSQWRERTNHSDPLVQDASKIWHKLCDWGVILERKMEEDLIPSTPQDWLKIECDVPQSRIVRFGDAQHFYGEEEVFHLGA
tara:strand:- start:409 stop:801 length:393 start_codon:yes stop_codon:yes gene_type:complete